MIEPTAGQQLDKMITGYWVSQAIYAAATFGIADHLKDGPRSVDDLAAATSTNSDALYRLLRALESLRNVNHVNSRSRLWLNRYRATFRDQNEHWP